MKFGALQKVIAEPLPSVFAVAAELGFDGVELDWRDPAAAQPGGVLGPENRSAIRQAAQQANVEIPSVAAHFLSQGGLADPNADKRAFGREALRAGIALCADLGAGYLLVPFFGPATIADEAAISRLIESLQRLAPEAETARVTLAIEHTLPGERTAALLEKVGSPYIAEYWDMGNCMGLGYDPLAEIDQLGQRIGRVHAKEYHRGNAPRGTQTMPHFAGLNAKPFGQGDVPISAVLAALRRVGYDGYIVLETGKFGDAKASAKAALTLLHERYRKRA